jgi:MFS transporter, FSR family, fosmidomycin resistance protein
MADATFRAEDRDDSRTAYVVLGAIILYHLLNGLIQSLLAGFYPLLKVEVALDFWQVGILLFV